MRLPEAKLAEGKGWMLLLLFFFLPGFLLSSHPVVGYSTIKGSGGLVRKEVKGRNVVTWQLLMLFSIEFSVLFMSLKLTLEARSWCVFSWLVVYNSLISFWFCDVQFTQPFCVGITFLTFLLSLLGKIPLSWFRWLSSIVR